jgi:hypothetical protein
MPGHDRRRATFLEALPLGRRGDEGEKLPRDGSSAAPMLLLMLAAPADYFFA